MRVRSWKILKYENIKVAEFLRGARFESLGVFTREMKLPSDQYINEEDFQFAMIEPKYVNLVSNFGAKIKVRILVKIFSYRRTQNAAVLIFL